MYTYIYTYTYVYIHIYIYIYIYIYTHVYTHIYIYIYIYIYVHLHVNYTCQTQMPHINAGHTYEPYRSTIDVAQVDNRTDEQNTTQTTIHTSK